MRHPAERGGRAGAGDHLVSEAFYLTDPDGLGVEVHADRSRTRAAARWRATRGGPQSASWLRVREQVLL